MSRPFRLSEQARLDLLRIWDYLAEQASFDVADKVIADLFAGIDKIGRLPALGHQRVDLTALPVKFFRVHSYLIIYAAEEKQIGVVRVIHGARDIPAILRGE